jgi:hypothetical protein
MKKRISPRAVLTAAVLLLFVPGLALPADAANAASTATATGTAEATALSAQLCSSFTISSELTGSTEQIAIAWMSGPTLGRCFGIPTDPPTGEGCVSSSGYLQECLDCCVYNNQTLLSCAGACFKAFPSIPSRPLVLPPVTPEDQCCKTWCADGGGAFGVTSCCNGAILSCDCTPAIDPIPELGGIMEHVTQCVQECEGVHQYNQTCTPGQLNPTFNDPVCGHPCSECTVNRCFVDCMSDFNCNGVPNPQMCQELMQELRGQRDTFCTQCTNCRNNQNQNPR